MCQQFVCEGWQAGLVGAVWGAAILQGDFGQNLPGFSTVFLERARYSICCCLYQLRKEFAVQKLGQPPSLEQNKLCFYPHTATCLSQAFFSTSVLRHRISLTCKSALGGLLSSFQPLSFLEHTGSSFLKLQWVSTEKQITPAMSQPTFSPAHPTQHSPSRLWIPCFWVSAFIHPSGRSCFLQEEMLQNAGRSSLQQCWDFWSCCKPCQPCPPLLQHSEDTECKLIRHCHAACQCRAALGIPGKWRARHFCTLLLCLSLESLESFSFSALFCISLFLWAWSLSGFNPSQHHPCKVDLWAWKPLLPSPAWGFHPVQSGKKKQSRSQSRCDCPCLFSCFGSEMSLFKKCLFSDCS